MATKFQEIMSQLAAPFPIDVVDFFITATNAEKSKGLAVGYVDNRAIQSRLDEVMGAENWKNEYREWRTKGVICGLSLRIDGEWVTKYDGADESDIEPTKGGLSDAMKRAAVQWGIGRYLYDVDGLWVPVKQQGKSTVIDGPKPNLPAWALPGGSGKPPVSGKGATPAKPAAPAAAAPAAAAPKTAPTPAAPAAAAPAPAPAPATPAPTPAPAPAAATPAAAPAPASGEPMIAPAQVSMILKKAEAIKWSEEKLAALLGEYGATKDTITNLSKTQGAEVLKKIA